jgi:hypothetical protein
MPGQNILGAASISPQIVLSQQLATTESALYTVPASTSVKIATASVCNILGSTSTQLATPVITLGTTATSGGTFAANTYYWKVTAINPSGETAGSNEVTATIAANGTQVLNWSAISGATGYRVYRGTAAGGENLLVATIGSGATVTYTDTGTSQFTAFAPNVSSFSNNVTVSVSLVAAGGTVGDGTHRVLNSYSLAPGDTLPLDMLRGAMLGPGDKIAAFAGAATAVDIVVTGTVHA